MKTNKLRIVLDTNVLIVSLASHLKYHWVFERLVAGHYDLFVTNEINDKHFRVLRDIAFPPVRAITLQEFAALLNPA